MVYRLSDMLKQTKIRSPPAPIYFFGTSSSSRAAASFSAVGFLHRSLAAGLLCGDHVESPTTRCELPRKRRRGLHHGALQSPLAIPPQHLDAPRRHCGLRDVHRRRALAEGTGGAATRRGETTGRGGTPAGSGAGSSGSGEGPQGEKPRGSLSLPMT